MDVKVKRFKRRAEELNGSFETEKNQTLNFS